MARVRSSGAFVSRGISRCMGALLWGSDCGLAATPTLARGNHIAPTEKAFGRESRVLRRAPVHSPETRSETGPAGAGKSWGQYPKAARPATQVAPDPHGRGRQSPLGARPGATVRGALG